MKSYEIFQESGIPPYGQPAHTDSLLLRQLYSGPKKGSVRHQNIFSVINNFDILFVELKNVS